MTTTRERRRPSRRVMLALAALGVTGTVVARRLGYNIGGNVVVRCRQGHLFTTLWLPMASLKAVRLGWYRVQRCPVGNHWTLVHPVREADLGDDELREARARHDVRLP